MTFRQTLTSMAAAVGCAAFLAGCMSSGGPSGGSMQTGFDGDWVGSDGVAVSTLSAGRFSSKSTKTGETLTTGTYASTGQGTIVLDFFSVKSQQSTKATCLLVDVNQMNCTLASGTQFSLMRKMA